MAGSCTPFLEKPDINLCSGHAVHPSGSQGRAVVAVLVRSTRLAWTRLGLCKLSVPPGAEIQACSSIYSHSQTRQKVTTFTEMDRNGKTQGRFAEIWLSGPLAAPAASSSAEGDGRNTPAPPALPSPSLLLLSPHLGEPPSQQPCKLPGGPRVELCAADGPSS